MSSFLGLSPLTDYTALQGRDWGPPVFPVPGTVLGTAWMTFTGYIVNGDIEELISNPQRTKAAGKEEQNRASRFLVLNQQNLRGDYTGDIHEMGTSEGHL